MNWISLHFFPSPQLFSLKLSCPFPLQCANNICLFSAWNNKNVAILKRIMLSFIKWWLLLTFSPHVGTTGGFPLAEGISISGIRLSHFPTPTATPNAPWTIDWREQGTSRSSMMDIDAQLNNNNKIRSRYQAAEKYWQSQYPKFQIWYSDLHFFWGGDFNFFAPLFPMRNLSGGLGGNLASQYQT